MDLGVMPTTFAKLCAGRVHYAWIAPVAAIRHQLDAQPTLPPKTPINAAGMRHNACDLSPEVLLQSGPPGHQLEAEPIVDHGEPTRSEDDALTIDAGDLLALGRRAVHEARFG